MSEYVVTLLAAAAVTYILTPLVRRFAIAVGAMHAARERDVHELPTPLLGGFAIYGGLAAALLVASRLTGLSSVFTETNMAKGLLLAGGLVVFMGFVDDRWGMGALSKLAGQVAAGVILVWSGAEIPWLPAPGGVTLILTSDQQIAVTILVVVVTMNAVNFIDGLDGLAAGIVGIGAIAFFAYYFTLTHRLGLLDQTEPALVSVLLAGVCIGFLPHNFYRARIFMGDTGSMLIGLLLAYAPISSLALLDPASLTDTAAYAAGTVNRYGAFIPLLVPAAILLIPYADLMMAVVRRTRAGTSVFAPDKKHLQHRLLAIGHSHRTSVLIMYLWAALFAGSVIWLSIVRTPLFVLAIVTVAALLALLLVTMPRLRPWSRPAAERAAAAAATPAPAAVAPARQAGPPWAVAPAPEGQDPVPAPDDIAAIRQASALPSATDPAPGLAGAGAPLADAPRPAAAGPPPGAPVQPAPRAAARPARGRASRPAPGSTSRAAPRRGAAPAPGSAASPDPGTGIPAESGNGVPAGPGNGTQRGRRGKGAPAEPGNGVPPGPAKGAPSVPGVPDGAPELAVPWASAFTAQPAEADRAAVPGDTEATGPIPVPPWPPAPPAPPAPGPPADPPPRRSGSRRASPPWE